MRIHTNLEESDIQDAAKVAGVTFDKLERKGSQSRSHAFEIKLLGDSPYAPMKGEAGERAASWDQWGIFLNAVFEADETAACAYYPTGDHFHFVTDGRFVSLKYGSDAYHRRHKWIPSGNSTADCECGAFQDWNQKAGKIQPLPKPDPEAFNAEEHYQQAIDNDAILADSLW